MCNLSEIIREAGIEEGFNKGFEKERLNAIERMLNTGFTKVQILFCGYTENKFMLTENQSHHLNISGKSFDM